MDKPKKAPCANGAEQPAKGRGSLCQDGSGMPCPYMDSPIFFCNHCFSGAEVCASAPCSPRGTAPGKMEKAPHALTGREPYAAQKRRVLRTTLWLSRRTRPQRWSGAGHAPNTFSYAALNCSKPESVSGCAAICWITLYDTVAMSAPASAHSIT